MTGQAWFTLALFVAVLLALSFPLAIYMARIGDAAATGYIPIKGFAGKFERLYRTWHRQSEAIQYSSNTSDYIALPAYRGIVGLGQAALPFLEKKLTQDRDADFMLAHAVVEICGWDRQAFASDSEQAFRDKILRKLKGNE